MILSGHDAHLCADSKDVQAALKGQPRGKGMYFPISACQVTPARLIQDNMKLPRSLCPRVDCTISLRTTSLCFFPVEIWR